MFGDLSVPEFVHLVHKPVQEIAVVGDHNQSTVKGFQGLFEYVLGLHVHMVCRFVQGQQIVTLKHQFGHSQPCPLSTREH